MVGHKAPDGRRIPDYLGKGRFDDFQNAKKFLTYTIRPGWLIGLPRLLYSRLIVFPSRAES